MTFGRRRLGLFYKQPVAGRVKTRLTPPLTPGEAARLYAAFLDDTLALVRSLTVDEIVLFEAGEPPGWIPDTGQGLPWLAQAEGDLGARMAAALDSLLPRSGDLPASDSALLLGSDAPTLPAQAVEEAFRLLEADRGDLVLGPAPDGGYVLIGVRRTTGALLRDGIAWSSPTTLEDTEERARRLGWRPVRSPGGWDVDTPVDLRRLLVEVDALDRRGDRSIALRTRQVLRELRPRPAEGA